MSFLCGKELEDLLQQVIDTPVYNSRIKQAAYELTLGDQVYTTDSVTGKKEILDSKNPQIIINPGQFALLITEEVVSIPETHMALISIKFTLKIKGLVNVSGFHVDPGFKGKIIFSVYNAGARPVVLDKALPYFLIWFSPLSSPAVYNGSHQGQNDISATFVETLKGELASPSALVGQITNLKSELDKKIDDVKSVKKRNQYFLQAIIGLLAGLLLTSFFNSNMYERGFLLGAKTSDDLEQIKKEIMVEMNKALNERDSVSAAQKIIKK